MAKKDARNTKGRIVDAAWSLFYEKGYEGTTIEEIVERSETSKGSFYHYFDSKDALLSSLSYLFDAKYEQLMQDMDPEMNSFDKLMYLNHELFLMIENSVPDGFARADVFLSAHHLRRPPSAQSEPHLLPRASPHRHRGTNRGQLRTDVSVNEIIKAYAMLERAMIYDWCICNGDYSLYQYSGTELPLFLRAYKAQ